MNDSAKPKGLSITLYVIGAIFIVGIFPMMNIWPAGWAWTPRQPEYEQTHLIGDVPALFLVAIILWLKMPRAEGQ